MIVRPVRSSDLAALIDLARSTGTGLTTLPANEERLAHRVGWAEKTFRGEAGRGDADYLFVLEDDDGRVVGISAIAGAVGMREPWYNFRVGLTVSASQELNIYREIPTLFLANDLTGNSELCSLFLHADYRSGLNGRMLSKARMLFIAEFPELFGNKIIAEMRGVSDDAGRSPFWESLGRHFFKMEFSQADYLTGVGNKAFIAELMPKFPLYTCFLSEGARSVIGQVHPDTEPALAMLKGEGFSYQGYVDIFDAGLRSNAKPARSARCVTVKRWCWPSAHRAMTRRRSSSITASAKTAASPLRRRVSLPARWWLIRRPPNVFNSTLATKCAP
jgi:arginine N-succinyltransferase